MQFGIIVHINNANKFTSNKMRWSIANIGGWVWFLLSAYAHN